MRVRPLTWLAATLILVAGSLPAYAVATPTPVKTTKAFEWLPAAGHNGPDTYLAWTQDILNKPNAPFSAFFQVNAGVTRRINPHGVTGFLGDFDAGTSTVAVQQVTGSNSDIRLYDVGTRTFGTTPAGVNTAAWQWSPSIDTDEGTGTTYLLYGENRFSSPTAPWRVILYDDLSNTKILLDQVENKCGCLFAGDVAYPWVVWSKGLFGNVWRYNIATQAKNRVFLPNNRDEYFASVTGDGTVYVAQAGDQCGTQAKLYRVAPGGAATLLFALPNGSEPLSINATDTGAGVTLYSDRYYCGPKTSNIFRIAGADTATRQLDVTSVSDGVRRTAATQHAWSRIWRSSLRCAASGLCRRDLRAAASA
jgi:hypothetical protein